MAKESVKPRGMDKTILFLVTVILIIGMIIVYSSSYIRAYYDNKMMEHFFMSNAKFGLLGFVIMLIVSRIPYRLYGNFYIQIFMVLVTLLLLGGLFVFGGTLNSAKRWYLIANRVSFQPSELAKIACILYMANVMAHMGNYINNIVRLIFILWFPSACAALIILQPHISTTVTIAFVTVYMLFIGGIHLHYLPLISVPYATVVLLIISTSNYARQRVLAIFSPDQTDGKAVEQIQNSLAAISSGGVLGKGLGRSVQKYLYLSASYNDFIFAIYAEELGFIGAVGLILLFFMLIVRCLKLVRNAPDRFSSLIVAGIIAQIAFQFMVNIGVAMALLPTTGVPLPFVSFGGTSLVMTMASMGIVLNISRYDRSVFRKRSPKEEVQPL